MQHRRFVENVQTFEQSIEATKFLAGLALEDRDGLDESAVLLPQEIVRDGATGKIVGVVALVKEDEDVRQQGHPHEERVLLGAA